MESKDIKIGMLVRFTKEWCDEDERDYVHIVIEDRTNPEIGHMRWLIATLGTGMFIDPQSVVEDYMIEPIEL